MKYLIVKTIKAENKTYVSLDDLLEYLKKRCYDKRSQQQKEIVLSIINKLKQLQ